jgi:formate dehydrogenase major subunit
MLIKRKEASARRISLAAALGANTSGVLDRRSFLRRSGLVAGGAAAVGSLSLGAVRKAEAAGGGMGAADLSKPIEIRKNMCTHCSVGCSVIAEVQNGVWVGQEPAWDSPINRGTHCAKGASSTR